MAVNVLLEYLDLAAELCNTCRLRGVGLVFYNETAASATRSLRSAFAQLRSLWAWHHVVCLLCAATCIFYSSLNTSDSFVSKYAPLKKVSVQEIYCLGMVSLHE